MTTPSEYAREHAQQFREQLYDLLRIQSVSTDPAHTGDMRRAAEWIAADLRRIGATNVEIMETGGHPVVYGDWLGAEGAPTVLVYGHYDVQPATMAEGWTSDPFEPIERDGLMYARGSSDDKGQMFVHLKALESYLATEGKCPVNLKFMIEGEEEIGSVHLGDFVRANKDRYQSDACVISDGGNYSETIPEICSSVRGLTYMQLEVTGPSHDLHSGIDGGRVHNPALALAQIIAQLHNEDNSIAVPGFYDDVVDLSAEERAELARLDESESDFQQETGAPASWGEAGYTKLERTVSRPTLEVNGLLSGFTGEGSKTVLPAKAMAKISCRLVANQNPLVIYELIKTYIEQITPPTVRTELKLINKAFPALIDTHTPAMQAAVRATESTWDRAPLLIRSGGTLPIMADLQHDLGVEPITLNFGLHTDGLHGPDEHFSLELFHRGIETTIQFYAEMVKSK